MQGRGRNGRKGCGGEASENDDMRQTEERQQEMPVTTRRPPQARRAQCPGSALRVQVSCIGVWGREKG